MAENNPVQNIGQANPPTPSIAAWYQQSPYSATAPQTNTGLINSPAAAPQVTAPNTVPSTAQIDPNQFNPDTPVNATMTGATGAATGYTANNATTNNVNVTAPQTVSSQITGLIAQNSPLEQQAQAQAAQASNAKGLLNSSMAVGSGESAVLNTALPIAEQDAQTNANAATFNANAANTTSQFNAGAANTAAEQNTQATNTQTLANQQSLNTAGQVNTTQANALQSQEIQQQGTVAQANQTAINNATAQSAQLSVTAQTANQSAAVQQSAQVYAGALQAALANTTAAGQLQLQQINAGVQTNVARLQAQYNVQMQTSASMSTTFQNYIAQSGAIMQDPNLDETGKATAMANLNTEVNNAMALNSNISGLNLGSLLNQDQFTGQATPDTSGLGGTNGTAPTNYAAPPTGLVNSNPADQPGGTTGAVTGAGGG